MTVILFEDELVPQLYPVTVGKPAFTISCGSYSLLDLVRQLGRPIREFVRPHLREHRRLVTALAPAAPAGGSDQVLLVNGRVVPSMAALEALRMLVAAGRPGIATEVRAEREREGQAKPQRPRVAAALLPAGAPLIPEQAKPLEMATWLDSLPLSPLDVSLPLLEYPHEIVKHHLSTLPANLEHRLAHGNYEQVADGVFLAPGARLGQYVVTETRNGPIVLEERASIGPYCYLSGPAHVGASARVIEHSAIKDGVALGHTTKIGGEVEGSVIEPYTNKQHHGFLGHSYLGSWINLGAGTCNSDLKNTYGQVNMEYYGQKTPTGMQFIGCIVGDYAKTAINTSIFTGKTIGACSMLYGFVTTNVPSFVNYARSFGQVTEAPVEIMVATQARMFARRDVQQRPCDVQLLYDMYDLTRHERQLAGEPLSL